MVVVLLYAAGCSGGAANSRPNATGGNGDSEKKLTYKQKLVGVWFPVKDPNVEITFGDQGKIVVKIEQGWPREGTYMVVEEKLTLDIGAKDLTKDFVRAVHALSELAIQQLLSVKGGKRPLGFNEFNNELLKPLENGQRPEPEKMSSPIRKFYQESGIQRAVAEILRGNLTSESSGWRKWLRRPSQLGTSLAEEKEIAVSLDDPGTTVSSRRTAEGQSERHGGLFAV